MEEAHTVQALGSRDQGLRFRVRVGEFCAVLISTHPAERLQLHKKGLHIWQHPLHFCYDFRVAFGFASA